MKRDLRKPLCIYLILFFAAWTASELLFVPHLLDCPNRP